MFVTLYIREIQNYLYSLRFQASLIIVLLVFGIGTVSFVNNYRPLQANYARNAQYQQQKVDKMAANLSRVASLRQNFVLSPRPNGVIADCKEGQLPNNITYNAFNVFSFDVRSGNVNPLIVPADSLSWSFIVTMFLSFITLLFAFDALSGEKEEHTLALVFSNPVSRKVFLFSKLASIVTVVTLMAAVGMLVSLLILAAFGTVQLNGLFLAEILGFLLITVLLITVFAAFGLLASAVTTHSNVSLLISLCFWLFSAVIIPNTAVFWAKKLFPIPSQVEVMAAYRQEVDDIIRNAPPGSSSGSTEPFYPQNELRANLHMALLLCEKKHADKHAADRFNQFEKTRYFMLLSPIAQFEYMNEAFLGGGYLRFNKNWNDLHIFQQQFNQWFKDLDANDPDSPHWYNPDEDLSTSRKPVSPDLVPRYAEQLASFGQRIRFIGGYLVAMVLTIGVLLSVCFIKFVKYDVR